MPVPHSEAGVDTPMPGTAVCSPASSTATDDSCTLSIGGGAIRLTEGAPCCQPGTLTGDLLVLRVCNGPDTYHCVVSGDGLGVYVGEPVINIHTAVQRAIRIRPRLLGGESPDGVHRRVWRYLYKDTVLYLVSGHDPDGACLGFVCPVRLQWFPDLESVADDGILLSHLETALEMATDTPITSVSYGPHSSTPRTFSIRVRVTECSASPPASPPARRRVSVPPPRSPKKSQRKRSAPSASRGPLLSAHCLLRSERRATRNKTPQYCF